jgi:DNA-binding IclR family transcriptional regulator
VEQSVRSVGVLDKSVALLRALAEGPRGLGELVAATAIPKPTAHRLATALAAHGLVRRTDDGRFALGAELVGLGRAAAEGWPWGDAAGPALVALVEATGESAQLYVREGDARRCLLSRESTHELRTIVAEGARLPLERGSAGRILLAATPPAWVESVEERAPGVASVSAPVRDAGGAVVAAVGISGPADRLGPSPGARHGDAVVAAARRIEAAL